MEYIQCPHCQKRYNVNDKIRAASGREICCKACQQRFEIVIFSTPTAHERAEAQPETAVESAIEASADSSVESATPPSNTSEEISPNASTEEADDDAVEMTPHPVKTAAPKFNLQIVVAAALGLLLIIAIVIAYQLIQKHAPGSASQSMQKPLVRDLIVEPPFIAKSLHEIDTSVDSVEKRDADVAPVATDSESASAAEPQAKAATNNETSETPAATTPVVENNTIDPLRRGPEKPSDDCKLAATDQWFVDYMITHGALSGSEYIRMLDESSSKTEEVRKQCNDKYLASRLANAAREGIKPDWIEAEINARATSIYGKGVEAEQK